MSATPHTPAPRIDGDPKGYTPMLHQFGTVDCLLCDLRSGCGKRTPPPPCLPIDSRWSVYYIKEVKK